MVCWSGRLGWSGKKDDARSHGRVGLKVLNVFIKTNTNSYRLAKAPKQRCKQEPTDGHSRILRLHRWIWHGLAIYRL